MRKANNCADRQPLRAPSTLELSVFIEKSSLQLYGKVKQTQQNILQVHLSWGHIESCLSSAKTMQIYTHTIYRGF